MIDGSNLVGCRGRRGCDINDRIFRFSFALRLGVDDGFDVGIDDTVDVGVDDGVDVCVDDDDNVDLSSFPGSRCG